MKLVVLTPVYNDWESFEQLLKDVERTMSDVSADVRVLAVNDDSISPPPERWSTALSVEVLHLSCNLGHQRAIAIGLAYLADSGDQDAVVVMDSDGEDVPGYIPAMLALSQERPDAIVVARRDKRSEGSMFRFGYRVYQLLFRLLTGRRLAFGNYCLIPGSILKRLVYQDSLWNHLAATILRSRFELVQLSTARGMRYAGRSSMKFGSLILLGLSAVSVYSDVALLRTLLGSFLMSMLAGLGIVAVTVIRLFSDLAIPGWASTVVGSMSIILIQCLIVSVFLLFIVLSNRTQRTFIPARHYRDYVLDYVLDEST